MMFLPYQIQMSQGQTIERFSSLEDDVLPIASHKELATGNGTEKLIRLWERSEPGPMEWLIDGIIPKGFISIIYGNSGLGKSYICKWLALSVVLGRRVMGEQVEKGNVLWLDFEMNVDEASRRLWRVSRGMGLEIPPEGFYYYRPMEPLGSKGLGAEIEDEVRDKGIKLVVIDSLSIGASASDVSEHRDVVGLLKTVEKWGTIIAIDHITKAAASGNQGQASIFGSTFKRAVARSTMRLTPAGGPGFVTLLQDKNNYGREAPKKYLHIDFESLSNQVSISQLDESDSRIASASNHLPAKDQVWFELVQAFSETCQPVSIEDLVERTGKSASRVRSYISELGEQVIKLGNSTYSPRESQTAENAQ